MIWYFLILLTIMLTILGAWYLVAKYRLKDSLWWTLVEHKKVALITFGIGVLLSIVLCWSQLYATAKCSGRGMITKMDTQYSWLMDECQARTVNGSYISIDRNRGIPDSNSHKDENNTDDFVIE